MRPIADIVSKISVFGANVAGIQRRVSLIIARLVRSALRSRMHGPARNVGSRPASSTFCRENPYGRTHKRPMGTSIAARKSIR